MIIIRSFFEFYTHSIFFSETLFLDRYHLYKISSWKKSSQILHFLYKYCSVHCTKINESHLPLSWLLSGCTLNLCILLTLYHSELKKSEKKCNLGKPSCFLQTLKNQRYIHFFEQKPGRIKSTIFLFFVYCAALWRSCVGWLACVYSTFLITT